MAFTSISGADLQGGKSLLRELWIAVNEREEHLGIPMTTWLCGDGIYRTKPAPAHLTDLRIASQYSFDRMKTAIGDLIMERPAGVGFVDPTTNELYTSVAQVSGSWIASTSEVTNAQVFNQIVDSLNVMKRMLWAVSRSGGVSWSETYGEYGWENVDAEVVWDAARADLHTRTNDAFSICTPIQMGLQGLGEKRAFIQADRLVGLTPNPLPGHHVSGRISYYLYHRDLLSDIGVLLGGNVSNIEGGGGFWGAVRSFTKNWSGSGSTVADSFSVPPDSPFDRTGYVGLRFRSWPTLLHLPDQCYEITQLDIPGDLTYG